MTISSMITSTLYKAIATIRYHGYDTTPYLCTNPAVTKDMIKQLYIKNTTVTAVQYVNDMLPWHMYLVNKDKRFHIFNEHTNEYCELLSTTMTDAATMILSDKFDVNTLVDANLDVNMVEMYLILTGSS